MTKHNNKAINEAAKETLTGLTNLENELKKAINSDDALDLFNAELLNTIEYKIKRLNEVVKLHKGSKK